MGLSLIGFSLSGFALSVWYILLVVLGLGMLIFVHELGHFLVAKLCGVKVEKFYLGFDIGGWKLWKFTRGETEYGIGVLPLGGYVKMLGQEDNPARLREEIERAKAQQAGGESDAPAAAKGDDALDVAEAERALYDPRSYLAQSVPKRMAIISAGVVMNVIFAFVTAVAAYKLGVFQNACGVGAVALGEPAWQENLRVGDEFLEIGGKQCDRFDDLQRAVSLGDIEHGVAIVVERPGVKEPFTVTINPSKGGLAPTIGITNPRTTALDKALPTWPGTAAFEAKPGFRGGDRIVRIGDEPIHDFAEVHRELALHRDQPLKVTVERKVEEDGKTVEVQETTIEVPVQPMLDLGLIMQMGPVTAVQEGSPAAEAGIQPDDVLLSIDGRPVGDPMSLGARLRRLAKDKTSAAVTLVRDGQTQTKNVQLREVDWYEEPLEVRPKSPMSAPALGVAFAVEPKVVEVAPGSQAAEKGVKVGDEVLAATLIPPDKESLEKLGLGKAAEQFSLGKRSVTLGKDVSWPSLFYALQTMLPGTQVELLLTGERRVDLTPQPAADWFNPDRGLRFEAKGTLVKAKSWGHAIRLGGAETADALTMVLRFLRKLGSQQVSVRAMGGPVSIFQIAYYAAERGLADLLIFLTLIGANLAVINFLPIPLLDGGHMVFLIYEGVTGRPPNERVQGVLTWAGLLFILGLFLLVMGLDVGLISRQ